MNSNLIESSENKFLDLKPENAQSSVSEQPGLEESSPAKPVYASLAGLALAACGGGGGGSNGPSNGPNNQTPSPNVDSNGYVIDTSKSNDPNPPTANNNTQNTQDTQNTQNTSQKIAPPKPTEKEAARFFDVSFLRRNVCASAGCANKGV